jgi:hypothetical protein
MICSFCLKTIYGAAVIYAGYCFHAECAEQYRANLGKLNLPNKGGEDVVRKERSD